MVSIIPKEDIINQVASYIFHEHTWLNLLSKEELIQIALKEECPVKKKGCKEYIPDDHTSLIVDCINCLNTDICFFSRFPIWFNFVNMIYVWNSNNPKKKLRKFPGYLSNYKKIIKMYHQLIS